MSHLGQMFDNIKLCERRDSSRRVYVASHSQNGENRRFGLDGNQKPWVRQIFRDSKEDRNKEQSGRKRKGVL